MRSLLCVNGLHNTSLIVFEVSIHKVIYIQTLDCDCTPPHPSRYGTEMLQECYDLVEIHRADGDPIQISQEKHKKNINKWKFIFVLKKTLY